MVHGVALLLGSVAVMLGFVAGLMYLAQSYRLKHKRPSQRGFKLPSLEWLHRVNKQSLFYSSLFVAVGLAAGVLLNATRGSFPWTDPVVATSSVLLLWLAVALLVEYCYKPAGQGRKVAYMTVATFIFLGLALGFVLYTKHVSLSGQGAAGERAGQLGAAAPGASPSGASEASEAGFGGPAGQLAPAGRQRPAQAPVASTRGSR
jgi:hypothetical protein